ncbi:hypothetical protein [Spirobacillus cienkowskii]|uniref:hypothetical protein n=1 Tax=Spirobacillus cienkowskii TaxID=495820 RepID=UPI0030CDE5EF
MKISIRYIIIQLVIIISIISCKRNNDDADLQEAFIKPKIYLFKRGDGAKNRLPEHIVISGEYLNCIGKIDREKWSISSYSNLASNELLIIKKDDTSCRLEILEIKLLNSKNRDLGYKLVEHKLNLINSPTMSVKNKNSNTLKIKLNYLLNGDKNKIIHAYIFDTLSSVDLSINEKLHKFGLDIESEDGVENFEVGFEKFLFKKFKLINNNDLPIIFLGLSKKETYNSTCDKNLLLNKGDSCVSEVLISPRNLLDEELTITANYQLHNKNIELAANTKKKITVNSINKNNHIDNDSMLKDRFLYRLYHFGNKIFSSVSYNDVGLYYSSTGVYGQFNKVQGIDDGVEIRGVELVNDTLYVNAYNGDYGKSGKGGLFFAKLENNSSNYIFEKDDNVDKIFNINSSSITSIYSYKNGLIMTTSNCNIYYYNPFNKSENIKLNDFVNDSVCNAYALGNKLVLYNNKNLYYSDNGLQNKFDKYLLNFDNESSVTNIAFTKDKIYIGTKKGLHFYNLNSSTFNSVKELGNNEIYDIKAYGNNIYAAAVCYTDPCNDKGVYFANLDKSTEFKNIYSAFNPLGVTYNGGIVYITTTYGLYYFINGVVSKNQLDKYFAIPSRMKIRDKEMFFIAKNNKSDVFISKDISKNQYDKVLPRANIGSIISIDKYKDNFFVITDNTILRSLQKSSHFKKNYHNYEKNFLTIKEFWTDLFIANDKLYISSKNAVYFSDYDENTKNFNKLVPILSGVDEDINRIFIDNEKLYILSDHSIYVKNLNKISSNYNKISLIEYGKINSIFVSNELVFLATDSGLWFTSNGIHSKFLKVNAFQNKEVFDISVIENMVYISNQEGLFSSVILDFPNYFKSASFTHNMEFSKLNDNHKYKGSILNYGKFVFFVKDNNLFVSDNNGLSFKNTKIGSHKNFCSSIFAKNDILYIGCKEGLFIAKNNYSEIFKLSKQSIANIQFNSIKNFGDRTYYASDKGMFYTKNNNIDNFDKVIISKKDNEINRKFKKLFSFVEELYAVTERGKVFSAKEDHVFKEVFENKTNSHKVLCVYKNADEIFLGTTDGVWVTLDNGKTYRSLTSLSNYQVSAIKKVGTTIYFATNKGFMFSFDGGETLITKNTEHGLGDENVHDFSIEISDSFGFSLSAFVITDSGLSISDI